MLSQISKNQSRVLAASGLATPIVMVCLWGIASILRPGYNQLTQRGSELGTGPDSIVMNLNLLVTGFLIVAFALGLAREVRQGKLYKIGLGFLLLSGVTESETAFFPCDPGCPAALGSVSQNFHLGISMLFFGSMALFALFIGISLNPQRFGQSYRHYSIITGLASIGLFAAFAVSVLTGFEYVGLVERLFLAPPFLWIGITGGRLLRQSS